MWFTKIANGSFGNEVIGNEEDEVEELVKNSRGPFVVDVNECGVDLRP